MKKELDRRVQRTRKLLLESLIDLILEKGYDAISITDITEHANVGRSTFYAHFENKEQLLFSGHDALTQSLLASHSQPHSRQAHSIFKELFQHAADNRHLAKAMIGKGGGDLMLGRMQEVLIGYFHAQAQSTLSSKQQINLFAHAFASAIIGLLSNWFEQEMPYTVEVMNEKSKQICSAFLKISVK